MSAVPFALPVAPSFGELAAALESCLGRERIALALLAEREAAPRAGGRGQGLEWALDDLTIAVERLAAARDLLDRLAPHEAAVRVLAGEAPR